MSQSSIFNIKTRKIYAYILPGYLLFLFSAIIPLLISFYMSLTNWMGGKNINFIGLKNYKILLTDVNFWNSFMNNLEFIGILLISQIGLAFIFALFIQSKRIYFRELHKKIIFFPAVLAPIVVAKVWQFVYNEDYGLIASIMRAMGLEKYLIPWLDDPDLVILSISIVLTWQYVGQFVIIILAGMQNIDKSVLEAAEIDGATNVKRAVYVVFPLLKSTISVCALLCISGCMKMFELVYAISGGGPGRASQLMALYAYDTAFKVHKIGYASTISIGMVILSLLLIIIFKILFRWIGDSNE